MADLMKKALPIFLVLFLGVGLFFGFAPPAANPGVVYEIEVTDHEQSPPRTETMEVVAEGKNLTMEVQSGEGDSKGTMIFRGDRGKKGEMVYVDTEKQAYYVMDDATIERMGGMFDEAQKRMEEALQHLTEEQREAIRKAQEQGVGGAGIPGAMKPPRAKSELKKTGERDTKNGYPCVKYDVYRDGQKIRELWVTDWDNVEGGAEARGAFLAMADFIEYMLETLPEAGPFGGPDDGDNMFDRIEEMNGFPIVTREFGDDGSLEGESSLRSARHRTLDPDAFEPPSGYKRMSMGPR